MLKNLYPDVAFYGLPGAGKSTAAAYLEQLGWARASFAGRHPGGVRDVAVRIYGPHAENDRIILNRIGIGLRDLDPDVWVHPFVREVGRLHREGRVVVTDDLRGDPEWWALDARGFVLIRVEAPEDARAERLRANGKLAGADDPFLAGLEDREIYVPDHVVYNESNDDALYEQLSEILNRERRRSA